MDKYIRENRTLTGIHKYLRQEKIEEIMHDYPINFVYDLASREELFVELMVVIGDAFAIITGLGIYSH